MFNKYFIYKFTNIYKNKSYIGKWTKKIEKLNVRYDKEIRDVNCKRPIINALRKYGIDNFKFEIIKETDSKEDLKLLEIYFIEFYDTFPKGYNCTKGGDGGPGSKKGRICSKETKLKMSLSKKGKPSQNKGKRASEETKLKQSIAKSGKKPNLSEEEKNKRSKRIIEYNKSIEGRMRISEKNKGAIVSDETKLKMSLAKIGNKNPNFGKPFSQERKDKIRISRLKTEEIKRQVAI